MRRNRLTTWAMADETVAGQKGSGSGTGGQRPQVAIHTDGACRGNPGPGGYGVLLTCGDRRRELAAGFRRTTNNRMELLAAIAGLEALKQPCTVTVYSDSQYLVNALNRGWISGWKTLGWQRGHNRPLKNADLWQRLDAARARHQVAWEWVRGHAGHAENERCDTLATSAADAANLPADEGFEAAESAGSR